MALYYVNLAKFKLTFPEFLSLYDSELLLTTEKKYEHVLEVLSETAVIFLTLKISTGCQALLYWVHIDTDLLAHIMGV